MSTGLCTCNQGYLVRARQCFFLEPVFVLLCIRSKHACIFTSFATPLFLEREAFCSPSSRIKSDTFLQSSMCMCQGLSCSFAGVCNATTSQVRVRRQAKPPAIANIPIIMHFLLHATHFFGLSTSHMCLPCIKKNVESSVSSVHLNFDAYYCFVCTFGPRAPVRVPRRSLWRHVRRHLPGRPRRALLESRCVRRGGRVRVCRRLLWHLVSGAWSSSCVYGRMRVG